jgi:hypothetical protein
MNKDDETKGFRTNKKINSTVYPVAVQHLPGPLEDGPGENPDVVQHTLRKEHQVEFEGVENFEKLHRLPAPALMTKEKILVASLYGELHPRAGADDHSAYHRRCAFSTELKSQGFDPSSQHTNETAHVFSNNMRDLFGLIFNLGQMEFSASRRKSEQKSGRKSFQHLYKAPKEGKERATQPR